MRTAILLFLALLLFASPAGAQPTPQAMRLIYVGAEGCPREQVLRDAIETQTQSVADPFRSDAPADLTVTITRQSRPPSYRALAEIHNADGSSRWTRAFDPAPSCTSLVEAVAFVVAVHLDEIPAPRPPPLASANPPLLASTHPLPDTARPHPSQAPDRWPQYRAGASGWLRLATAPRPSAGVSIDLGVRWPYFSVGVEGRWDPPASDDVPAGTQVSTALLMGALIPCGHWSKLYLFGCAFAELGQLRADALAAHPLRAAGLYAAAGARLGVELPVAPHLAVRVSGELLGTVSALTLRVDSRTVWVTPPYSGGLGAGLVTFF